MVPSPAAPRNRPPATPERPGRESLRPRRRDQSPSAIPQIPIGFRLAHELEGLLLGISADRVIVQQETDRLVRWLAEAAPYRDVHPFSELAGHVERALSDGHFTLEECEDLLFVTSKLTTVNPYFGAARTGLQVLMGVLAGVSADRRVNATEVAKLNEWAEQWRHLTGLWPYDECHAIVACLLDDPTDVQDVEYLLSLSGQFPIGGHLTIDGELPPLLIDGICAKQPSFEFPGRQFVFTGESSRGVRADLEALVVERDGVAHPRLTQKTDYLVVCDQGSPYWAFACYGRKVERAYEWRREGHPIVIAHEADFWNAVGH
jgi:hypothetical protein